MELSWSTFLLETINFLVLIWILKRFLYRPVLDVIEKRRTAIEQTMNAAKERDESAQMLQQQYEGRLVDWDREKQQLMESLQQEIQTQRKKLVEQLNSELETEREKQAVVQQRKQAELQQQYQAQALAQGARFASKILHTVVTPELDKKLFELTITQLSQMQDENKINLQQTQIKPLDKIVVTSAFQLSDKQQQQLQLALENFQTKSTKPISTLTLGYELNSELMAGLRIVMGSWVLRLNLQDELSGFAALTNEQVEH